MTWMEVSDSAVKIGLGALIAGVFTLLGGRAGRRHEIDKERLRRRQDFLEKVADDLLDIDDKWTSLMEFMLSTALLPDRQTHLDLTLQQVNEARTRMKSIEAKLRLFGLHKCEDALSAYTKAAEEFDQLAGDIFVKGSPKAVALTEVVTPVAKRRMDALQELYRRLAEAHMKP